MRLRALLTAVVLLSVALPATIQTAAAQTPGLTGQISATNQLEYSYNTETQLEIFENWLDVSYYLDGFRTGLLLNSRQPSEKGQQTTEIAHRFFEFSNGDFDVRAGHFYGMFGRGLIFSAYEDRVVRVDTALDGVLFSTRKGRFQGSIFSGTPSDLEIDVRGMDVEYDLGRGWQSGWTNLTHLESEEPNERDRMWMTGWRLQKYLDFADFYLEYAWKLRNSPLFKWPLHSVGRAIYGSLNLYTGSFALALEAKDYDRFTVLELADGTVSLNNPPALTREHLYSLLSRNTHNLNANDEVGGQAELTWTGPAGWSLVASGNHTENHDGKLLFKESYGHVEKEAYGQYRVRAAYGYQDVTLEQKGINHFIIGELTLDLDETRSLTLQVEHQHTELADKSDWLEVGPPPFKGTLDPGSFDTQLITAELALAPHWTFAALLEVNNKTLPEQETDSGEREGPFPAGTFSYTTDAGGTFTVWAGKRQAGQLCVGGVCKWEPAFEGIECYWLFRY